MKCKVTKSAIKSSFPTVLSVGYCQLQTMLKDREPFAYSTGAEGWACDYYDIGSGICVSTGYRPIGKAVSYDICKKYDNEAATIFMMTRDCVERLEQLSDLIARFKKEACNDEM